MKLCTFLGGSRAPSQQIDCLDGILALAVDLFHLQPRLLLLQPLRLFGIAYAHLAFLTPTGLINGRLIILSLLRVLCIQLLLLH